MTPAITDTAGPGLRVRGRSRRVALAALFAGAALAAPFVGAQGSKPATAPLTLQQALDQARQRSPALQAAAADQDVAAARLRAARAWPNPTLGIETENVLGDGAFADFGAAETTVTLSQPLPWGGGRRAGLNVAKLDRQVAAIELQLARRTVRHDVTVAYAEALAADRLSLIARERARVANETQAAVEKRFAAGLESELQRARIAVESSGLRAAARRALAESDARSSALARLWRDDRLDQPLDGAWFDSTDDAAALPAASEHPRIALAQLQRARAAAAFDAARAQRVGGIEATVGTRQFKDLPSDSNRAFVLGLAMPLPLWQRNWVDVAETRARLGQAEIDAEAAPRELRAAERRARAELEAALLDARALAAAGLPAAESAARLSQQGYDAGRLSLLERLSAERSLFDVREQLERARLAVRIAQAALANVLP